jgi:hypothetical protein
VLLTSYSARSQVVVTASAGTAGPTTYTTLKDAFDAVNAGTHQGTINLSVTGNTSETAMAVLNASGSGSALYTALTVKPAASTNPVISGAVAGPLVKLNGSNSVTIDGANTAGGTTRNLTITNTSTNSSDVLLIGSVGTTAINNVVVKNSILINGINTSTAVVASDAGTLGNPGYFTNITLQNNSVQKAYIGIYLTSVVSAATNNVIVTGNDMNTTGANAIRNVGVYAQGVNGATISNNNLSGFSGAELEYDRSIWVGPGTKNITVSGNSISNLAYTGTSGYAPIGICIASDVTACNVVVTGNSISNITSSGTATTMGILYFSTGSDITISKNNIFNIKNTNTLGYGAAGILLAPSITSSATKVNNNFISDVAAYGFNGFSSEDNGNGIVIDDGGGYDIYHNTVVINTNATLTGGHRHSALLITANVTATGAVNLRDNILANLQTVGNANSRIVLSNAASSGVGVFGTINNNAYYATSTNLSCLGTNPTITNTLAQLQTSLGQNANSFAAQPLFVSATDFHMSPTNTTLSNSGVPVGSITTDIDGDTRNATTPDIGADEFVPCAVVTVSTQPGNATICPGRDTSFTTASPNGTLFQWQVNTGSGFADITNGGVYSGATAATLVLTNVPFSYNGYTYRCKINSFSVCTATNTNAATLTVNPAPVGVITPASSTSLCPGGSVVLNANTGFTYQWQKNGVNTAPPTSTINYTANATGSYTVIITNTTTGCRDTSDVVSVIVNPVITATQAKIICASQLPYTWNSIVVTAGGSAAATFTTASLVTGCDSTTTLNLTVNTVVTATQNLSVCAGQLPYNWHGHIVAAGGNAVAKDTTASFSGCDSITTLNLSINPLITATKSLTICASQLPYTWNSIVVNAGGPTAATYTTASLVTGCDSTTTLNLTVTPTPNLTVTPLSQTICSGTATSLALSSTTTGATIAWTIVQNGTSGATAGSGASIAQTLTATGTTAGKAVYAIIATANSCPSATIRDTITVNPAPAVVATPTSQTICSGTATSIALSSLVTGTTFAWTAAQTNVTGATASNGSSIAQTITATTAVAGTATYTVTPTANSCPGPNTNIVVTVNPAPATPGTITGSDAPCVGSTQTYSVAAVAGATSYIWTLPVGWTGTSATNSISVVVSSNSGSITVKASNTCGNSAAMTKAVTAVPVVTPTVSISSNAGSLLCSGKIVTFTAVTTNGGASPIYQWKVNGGNAGFNNSTFQYAPANGDMVTCVFTTSAVCASVAQLTSNQLTMQVTPTVNAALNIFIPENHICSGSQAVFVATPTNGGTTPQYQWKLNNSNTGTNSANFSYLPADGDVIACEMTSNAVCASPAIVLSNPVPMTIVVVTHPAVTITSNPSSGVLNGQSVTFTANVVQGGAGNQVSWYKNGEYILNSGGPTWTGIAGVDFKNKHKIQARVQSLSPCADPDTAWSNTLTMQVGTTGIDDQELPDGFSIYPNPATKTVNVEGLKAGDKASIFDALGNRLTEIEIKTDKTTSIDVSSFAQGMYFIHFARKDAKQWQVKIIKQ